MKENDQEEILFEGLHCTLRIERPATGIVVMRITGRDVGEFGDAPMQELMKNLPNGETIELFVDARNVQGASINVSNDWAQWLRTNRSRLRRMNMLTGSRFIQLTADFVRRFAELEDLMRIYTDPVAFDAAVGQAVAAAKGLADEVRS